MPDLRGMVGEEARKNLLQMEGTAALDAVTEVVPEIEQILLAPVHVAELVHVMPEPKNRCRSIYCR